MQLRQAEPEQTAAPHGVISRDDLQKITALAARLQEERQEQLSPEEVVAIGQELGIAPEFMQAAMEQIQVPESEALTVPVVQRASVPVRQRNQGLRIAAAVFSAWVISIGIYLGLARQGAPLAPRVAVVSEVPAAPLVLPPPYVSVNLESAANQSLSQPIHGRGTELNTLPQGLTKLGGAYFRLDGRIVHLRGAHARQWPSAAEDIPVQQRLKRLHFLHSTGYGAGINLPTGTEIGEYVVHYADGASARVPIVYGEDVLDWWEHAGEPPLTRGKVAWIGTIEGTDEHRVRLFKSEWRNPHPQKTVTSIDFRSHGTECDPFLAGITAEQQAR